MKERPDPSTVDRKKYQIEENPEKTRKWEEEKDKNRAPQPPQKNEVNAG